VYKLNSIDSAFARIYDKDIPNNSTLFHNTGKRGDQMKKISISDAPQYEALKHFKMTALRLHGKAETGTNAFWMGLSHFLPGGGAEYDASPTEKIYFVLEGEVTVVSGNERIVLGPWDSLFIGPGEGREVINDTNRPASMLVVISY
jgi:quercetin dioxygenase-like cupin family protein